MNKHKEFMKIAIDETKKGLDNGDGGPFGAVVVCGGKVIAKAHNTVHKDINPTHHAEINVITEACKELGKIDLSDCILYSTTEPCPMCLSAIHWAKIPKVVYGATIKDAKEAGFNEINLSDEAFNRTAHLNIELVSGVLRKETKDLFRLFKEKNINTY